VAVTDTEALGPAETARQRRWPGLLWAGFVSFALPEVFAGTSSMWPVRPDAYVLVMPLYIAHFLMLAQVAAWTRRTSWPALYLFGIVFALYETWVTKVIWWGYPGSEGFAVGALAPHFGAHETLGLMLFYHPVVSFLLPLAAAAALLPDFAARFPSSAWLFGDSRSATALRLGLGLVLAIVTGHNLSDPAQFVITWGATLIVVFGGYRLVAPKAPGPAAWRRELLGRGGTLAIAFVLLAIYGLTYRGILPEHLPPVSVQIVTVGIYLILAALIWRSGRVDADGTGVVVPGAARVAARWLLGTVAAGFVFMLVSNVSSGLSQLLILVGFLPMMAIGTVLLIYFAGWKILLKR
jgi:hypothetical protein